MKFIVGYKYDVLRGTVIQNSTAQFNTLPEVKWSFLLIKRSGLGRYELPITFIYVSINFIKLLGQSDTSWDFNWSWKVTGPNYVQKFACSYNDGQNIWSKME